MSKRWISFMLAVLMLLGLCIPQTNVYAAKKKKKTKVEKVWKFDDIKDRYAIAADVKVDGLGDGYHSKLVFVAKPECGVSFGIQYDVDALPPYKNRLALIVENIYSNQPGGQFYYRPSKVKLKPRKTYHLMMSLDKKGNFSVYFNHKKIGSYYNQEIAGKQVYPRVEGCAKHNGDLVKADFNKIHLKIGPYDMIDLFDTFRLDTAPDIKSVVKSVSHVVVKGHLTGIDSAQDWDSAYNDVSGIVQYHLTDLGDDDYDYTLDDQ